MYSDSPAPQQQRSYRLDGKGFVDDPLLPVATDGIGPGREWYGRSAEYSASQCIS